MKESIKQFTKFRLALRDWLLTMQLFRSIHPYYYFLIYASIGISFINWLPITPLYFLGTLSLYIFWIGVITGLTHKNLQHVYIGLSLNALIGVLLYSSVPTVLNLLVQGFIAYQLFRYDALKEHVQNTAERSSEAGGS